MQRKDCFFLVIMVLFANFLFAQKIERERRIPRSDFPNLAQQYLVDSFSKEVNWRYYEETSKDGQTFEAKGRVKGYPHSVEFFPDGSLMDVEITISLSELPGNVRKKFERDLSETYQKYRFLRVQSQFSTVGTRFEIELKAKSEKKWHKYQYLIDDQGLILEREDILSKPIDFIFY
ncbi:MAG: hypothetical protein HKN87_03870 [Saprospiraceae bacterium]|nr:hypothetical protein [Saprospiraceae bacterium]